MSKVKLEYLKKLTSDDFVDGLLADAEENKNMLDAIGIDSKEVEEPEVEPTEELVEDEPKELTPEIKEALDEYLGGDAEELKEFLSVATKMLPAMAQKIVDMDKALQKSEEDKEEQLADMIESAASKRTKALGSRPSEDSENLVKDDEVIEEPHVEGAEDMWLSRITGTKPVEAKQ